MKHDGTTPDSVTTPITLAVSLQQIKKRGINVSQDRICHLYDCMHTRIQAYVNAQELYTYTPLPGLWASIALNMRSFTLIKKYFILIYLY